MYKKFSISVLLITLTLYLLYAYFVLNYKIMYMNREYPMWLHVKQTIDTKTDDKYDLIVLGDSRAMAGFIPNELHGISSINLSMGGATPLEGYYTLKRYLKNNPPPDKIIFSYTPTHLTGKIYYWERIVPFGFLEDKEYQEVEVLAKKFNEKNIIDRDESYIDYKYPKPYGDSFKNGIMQERWKINEIVMQECRASYGHHFFGTKQFDDGLNAESSKHVFRKSKFQNYYFNKLLELAKSHGIKLYYYTMPFNKASYKKVDKGYVKGYQDYVKYLSSKYNIKVCNDVFYMDDKNFGDSSHLFKGAKKNTLKMYECVK